MYCCGTCTQMGCCSDRRYRISKEDQEACYGGSTSDKRNKLSTLLGSILGSVLPVLLCVGLVICCVAPCCLFYKKCRKGRNQNAGHPNVINLPQRPHNPAQPTNPGYQPVPVQPGYGGPSGPPAYHGGNPGAFSPGQPMYPLPNQPYANPGGMSQPAYNPAYPNLLT
ncbi:cuticle collagen 2C-like [Notolabrus celidotus]|uniref:cuticle collagen 2C-like n=1 Tax=Notolabrus celidotus TaxID=1203425 RepID=UPI00148F98AE|nr:cuticle collagen 2C-like [Notolabrus celidotus]